MSNTEGNFANNVDALHLNDSNVNVEAARRQVRSGDVSVNVFNQTPPVQAPQQNALRDQAEEEQRNKNGYSSLDAGRGRDSNSDCKCSSRKYLFSVLGILFIVGVIAGISLIVLKPWESNNISHPRKFDPQWCARKHGIEYRDACIWHEETPTHLTYSDALRTCQSTIEAKLPEFYNEADFDILMGFMRGWIPTNETHVFAWTSMLRNPETGNATLSNGSPAPYTHIRSLPSEWTEATDAQTHVYLLAHVETAFEDKGMGARWPTYNLVEFHTSTVICQSI